MNPRPSRRSRPSGKVEASVKRSVSKAEGETPIARFTLLAHSDMKEKWNLLAERGRADRRMDYVLIEGIVAERKAKVKLPTGQEVDAFEVPVDELSERWSEFKLEDGTIFRVKMSVLTVHRVPDMWDPQGNPFYVTNLTPVIAIIESPERLRKKVN